MSTISQVRTAWDTNVFQNASITAITDKIYDERMERNGTTSQLARLKYGQEYNWIEYLVDRFPSGGQIGQRRWEYVVSVSMYREILPDGTNHTATIDNFETLQDLVVTGLGVTWGGAVDLWLDVESAPDKDEIAISNKRVLVLSQSFRAEKYI